MSVQGLNFFYNQLNIPTDAWKIFYTLNSSGGFIPSISGANSIYTGIPTLPTTGVFSGQNVYISNNTQLNANNWTMMFVFEKFDTKEGVLFSNYHGNNIKSGFAVGVNSANRLYLETYGDNGPDVHEADINLATRNAMSVSKIDNKIEFSYFDFNSKKIYSDSFFASDNSFLPSNNWYLGNTINPPSYFSGNPFNGKIEIFTYMTGSIFPPQKIGLFSGLTLLQAPDYHLGLLSENCAYSYLNLTGNISSITFDTIQNAIFCVQTGYLFNQIGQLQGNITGIVSGGSGVATGYLSGYLNQPSGYTISTTGLVSGFSGYVPIGQGIRVFQNTLPSGADNYFIPFPSIFNSTPVVFTELQDNLSILTHEVSGISSSGFYSSFSIPIPSTGYVLTSLAAPVQTSSDLEFFKTGIPINTDNFYVNFLNSFTSIPKVFCQIENPPNDIFSYGISNVSQTGFNITFSNRVEFPGVNLHVFCSDLNTENSFETISTNLISGTDSQFIPYSPTFPQSPIIFGEMMNISGESIVVHQISGLSTSGFYALFSNTLTSNNYRFNSLSWSGAQNGVGYVYNNQQQLINLGQITDTCQNIYNLSGYQNFSVATQFDLSVTKALYFTGITGSVTQGISYITTPIFTPVGYTITLNTGQLANFTHQITYQNDATNFIKTDHVLQYSGANVQPDPFTIYKTCYQNFGYILNNYIFDTGYIYSFGMDGVHYLKEINDQDISELYVFPQIDNKINVDVDSIFDRTINQFFTYKPYTIDSLNIYLNGQALFGGGYQLTGDMYHQELVLDFDYLLTGNYIFSNGFMDGQDNLVFDAISLFFEGQRRGRCERS